MSGAGLKELLYAVKDVVVEARNKIAEEQEAETVPVLKLADTSAQWRVSKENGVFLVTGHKIEKFAQRTDFSSEEGLQRLRDIMRKMGIMHKLQREGLEPGSVVQIGGAGRFTY